MDGSRYSGFQELGLLLSRLKGITNEECQLFRQSRHDYWSASGFSDVGKLLESICPMEGAGCCRSRRMAIGDPVGHGDDNWQKKFRNKVA